MPHFVNLKHVTYAVVGLVLMMVVPFSEGKNFSLEKRGKLRIVYSGKLLGKTEPCG